jgi:hypothetical protein
MISFVYINCQNDSSAIAERIKKINSDVGLHVGHIKKDVT